MHAHTSVHTYIHTYIHTDRQTDRQTDIHTYIHTCSVYVHAYYARRYRLVFSAPKSSLLKP